MSDQNDILELSVVQMRVEAEGVLSLILADPAGRPLPTWEAGAHIAVHLGNGLIRQYSLCGDPRDTSYYRIGILREPNSRGGSAYIHTKLRPGNLLSIEKPRNNFALLPSDRYIFIAGGIGITPILPMLDAADRAHIPWSLHYGGRHAASMAFRRELAGRAGQIEIVSEENEGMLDLAAILSRWSEGTRAYCCGPEGLLSAIEARCAKLPPGSLQIERFKAAEPDATGDTAFEIVLERLGLTLTVTPGVSILETIEAVGVDVNYSCREGTCGVCETKIIDGIADHRDVLLSPEERAANKSMMICCSRSKTPHLVLAI